MEFNNEPSLTVAKKHDCGVETVLVVFSLSFFNALISITSAVQIKSIEGCYDFNLYAFERDGKRIGIARSTIGAPAAAALAEELFSVGVENIVAFGFCGTLINIKSHIVIPDIALRDEGTSKSYTSDKSDIITIDNALKLKEFFDSVGAESTVGGVWTTDAFYRETQTAVDCAVERGCIVVDMECSALQAVCNYRNMQLYAFFLTADSLEDAEWNNSALFSPEESNINYVCDLAVKVALAAY